MEKNERNSLSNYLTLVYVCAFAAAFLVLFPWREKTPAFVTWIGLCLFIPSIILFSIARIQLGSAFQVSAEANKLVKTGIYKKLRHPIYYFGFTFLLGIALITHFYPFLIVLLLLVFLQRTRMKREEAVLAEKFGDEYAEYRKQTWF
jgi:protein-S-isoprenylcysteine O-methyltransferase Ste14